MSSLPAIRELRALDVVEVVPAGCFALLVTGEAWCPHLRPGELAIVDTADREPQPGELYALTLRSHDSERAAIVQPFRLQAGTTDGPAVPYYFALPRPGTMRLFDGPISLGGWHKRCRGRVMGVMLAP